MRRAVILAYIWIIAGALLLTGTTNLHPTLGRIWDGIVSAGAAALAAVPFVRHARGRATLVAFSAFVIILEAEEWIRLVDPPVGYAIGGLWISAILGVVTLVSVDEDIRTTT